MSQSTMLSTALTAAQLAAMNGEQIVKMGRELIAQLGDEPDSFHGNIWPGNIHLDDDGKAVLGEGSDAPVSARTPEQIEYMAPEAFWQNDFSRSADLYSIALLMFTAYNGGRLPFTSECQPDDAARAQALRTRMKGGEIVLPESVSEAVGEILKRELSYSASDRYLTAQSMMHDLGDTDEALPSEAPDGEQAADPQAAAAAAATGMTGVSVVAEIAALPKEAIRPIETAAGVTASSILMEKELDELDAAPAASANMSEPLKEIFAEPEQKPIPSEPEENAIAEAAEPPKAAPKAAQPKAKKAAKPTAKKAEPNKPTANRPEKANAPETPTEKAAQPPVKKAEAPTEKSGEKAEAKPAAKSAAKPTAKKQYTVEKSIDRREESAAKRKNRSGAALVIGAGVLVVAGLLGVTMYSLGAFEKQEPMAIVTAEPMAEATATPTAEPTATPVVPSYHFTATAVDLDWDELENVGLAVLDREEAFDAAVAAAEAAKLENLWLGARYLESENAPNGEAGWYWLDDTQLPENSAFWAQGEPSATVGGRLMLCRASNGQWRFHAVTREMFDEGEYPSLGCITDGSGMAAVPTPRPTATPEPSPSAMPEADEPQRSYTYYAPSAAVTVAPSVTVEPTAAPTAAPTPAPVVTAEPTATPVVTPTPAPEKYKAEHSDKAWSALNTENTKFVTILSAEDFTAVVKFLNAYNEANENKLYNVWLGAEYKAAEGEAVAGWYWTDGTALASDDTNWASNEAAKTESHLMLRYDTETRTWQYYAVTDTEFKDGLSGTYANSGVVTLNEQE